MAQSPGVFKSLSNSFANIGQSIKQSVTAAAQSIASLPGQIAQQIASVPGQIAQQLASLPGILINTAIQTAVNAVVAVLQPILDIVNGIIDIYQSIVSGELFKQITDEVVGLVSGITNSIVNSVNAILDPIKRLGELKDNVEKEVIETAKIPEKTANSLKTAALASANVVKTTFTSAGETLVTSIGDAKTQLARKRGIDLNIGGIGDCIVQRVKDLLGVFVSPLGLFSLDQFKIGGIATSINKAFDNFFGSITGAITATIDGIKGLANFKLLEDFNQMELGRLELAKFFGCSVDLKVTAREKRDAAKKPSLVTETVEREKEKSIKKLEETTEKEFKNAAAPPDSTKSAQNNLGVLPEPVPVLTNVEETDLFTINFVYNIEDFIVKEGNREFNFIKDSPEFQSIGNYEPYILSRSAKKEVLSNLENQFKTQIESYKSQIIQAKNNNKVPTEEETVSSLAKRLDRQINRSVYKVKDLFLITSVYSNKSQEIEFYSNVYNSLLGPTSKKLIGGSIEEESKSVEGIYKKITNRDYNKLATRVLRILGYDKRKLIGW